MHTGSPREQASITAVALVPDMQQSTRVPGSLAFGHDAPFVGTTSVRDWGVSGTAVDMTLLCYIPGTWSLACCSRKRVGGQTKVLEP